jgi:hypothetical protein
MKLLIIGYCHLDDGFLYASKALEKFNIEILFFPYLSYIMDNIENRDNILIDLIKDNRINVCLWWCNNINYDSYFNIISNIDSKIKNFFYNWDIFLYNYQKYDSNIWEERINNKKLFYPLMDHVFTCSQKEIEYYINNPVSITYNYPGFDKNISYYYYDKLYECDISIVCTNLYNNINEFPFEATNITRFEIVDKLYENRDKFKFHIYGTENLKNKYPDCYRGFIKYQDCKKVFSNSKINLSIHPIIYELDIEGHKNEYFSERVPQILVCKGLLVTNSNLSNILKKEEDYIYIDRENNWFNKITDIINNSNNYDTIRENGYQKALQNYQWDKFAYELIKFI